MANSTRQKIRAEIATRLAAITTANGYSTNFTVYDDQLEAQGSTDIVAAWVTFGDEEGDLGARALSGDQPMVVVLQVSAYLRKATDLVTLQENALQDLRNKMQTSLKAWRSTTGATMTGYDTCETDEGTLAFKNLAVFTQGMVFTYKAGPTW